MQSMRASARPPVHPSGFGGRQAISARERKAYDDVMARRATIAVVAVREGVSKSTVHSWMAKVRDHIADERNIARMVRP